MKKLSGCIFFALCITALHSQVLHVNTGKTASSFIYKTSYGQKLNDLQGSVFDNYALGIGFPSSKNNFSYLIGLTYQRYGALGSNKELGNTYQYDVSCLGLYFAMDYEFLKPRIIYNEQKGFSFFTRITLASEMPVGGWQKINHQVFDIKGKEEFDRPFYFFRAGIGFNYYFSKVFSVFFGYNGGSSFLIGNYQGKEQLRILTHSLNIGLSVNLFYNTQ